MADRLRLSRDQLAKIVDGDFEAIKQFEKLFGQSNLTQEQIEELTLQAMATQGAAYEALAQLARIANALEFLASMPRVEPAPADPMFIPPSTTIQIAADPLTPPAMPNLLCTAADVSIQAPENHDVLVFDGASKLWRNVGPLLPQSGGTGTATAFTAGSVVFAGASGIYQQDATTFFWDATNNRLGVGTNAPGEAVDVDGNIRASGAVYAGDNDLALFLVGDQAVLGFDEGAGSDIRFDRTAEGYFANVNGSPAAEFSLTATSFVTPAGFKLIEVGAADSGGVGYRMLRVTN